MTHPKPPLPTEEFQSLASAVWRHLHALPSCPPYDTTSFAELEVALTRPVDGPAAATPPSTEADKDTQHPAAVLQDGSSKHPKAENEKNTGVRGRATGPVFQVKRKNKKGEALYLVLSDISPLFPLRISEAAQELGISTSSLKKACHHVGLHRWPGRKVRSLESTIAGMELAIVRLGADPGSSEVARMRFEIRKLQQELNELCHGTLEQITEIMRSPAVIATIAYKHLYSKHSWRSRHHNPGQHDVNKGTGPKLTSARENSNSSTRANREAKAKQQPTPIAEKESSRQTPRKFIRPSPRRRSSRRSSFATEMKASDLDGLLPAVHNLSNVGGDGLPESAVQARNGSAILISKTETGDEGTANGKVAAEEEEEGAPAAEPRAKRPKTELRCWKCGKVIFA